MEEKRRECKPMLVPMIAAAIAAPLYLAWWGWKLLHFIVYLRGNYRLPFLFRIFVAPLLLCVAAVCLVLFVWIQCKKRRPTLFGSACLIVAVVQLFYAVSCVIEISQERYFSIDRNVIDYMLSVACTVLFLIEAIAAFRGRIKGPSGIAGACVLKCFSLFSVAWGASRISQGVYYAADAFLVVALLLIAVLGSAPRREIN